MDIGEPIAGTTSQRALDERREHHEHREHQVFSLRGSDASIQTFGVRRRLALGYASTLEDRVRAFFADETGGPNVLVGALPFDTNRDTLFFQPERVIWEGVENRMTGVARSNVPLRSSSLQIVGEPDAAAYAAMVEQALARIGAGDDLRKIVLSRRLRIHASAPVDPMAIVERLACDPKVTTFLVDLSVASGAHGHRLVGATPELLVSRKGLRIASHPLAGSAARSADPEVDRRAAEDLLRSEKDRREHALVVEAVFDTLSPVCAELSAPEGIGLQSTSTMWHLGTRIEGVLKSEEHGPSAAGLAAMLHPTPAVGGHPREAALEAIRALEPHDRGFYAGAVGWTDTKGDGHWYVALRCAEIRGSRLTLHAGAGIVAGSTPDREVAETSAKFRAMLHALGIHEDGAL
ncbi:isochorismate synthase MenF [Pendulispora albinea]|uniref:isochorismate synthase n=1 Tax=Pendulispora albinea TaxID=2741071 RepID=A0ABZ2LQ62_9BACT